MHLDSPPGRICIRCLISSLFYHVIIIAGILMLGPGLNNVFYTKFVQVMNGHMADNSNTGPKIDRAETNINSFLCHIFPLWPTMNIVI